MDKKQLRRRLQEQRQRLTPQQVVELSRLIREQLMQLPAWDQAAVVMTYMAFGSEVETMPILQAGLAQGKRMVVPVCRREGWELIPSEVHDPDGDLAPGTWGILEPPPDRLRPIDPGLIDLVLVPGLAFDRTGNRLGYGAGYYDRFLPRLRPAAPRVALAYSLQLLPLVTAAVHDQPMDLVITETQVIGCRRG